MKVDTEYILRSALAQVQANLNAEIALINTAKGDFSISDIPANAYFFQSLPKGVFNYKQFLVYGLEEPSVTAAQSDNVAKDIKLFFEVVSVDAGENFDQNLVYKLLRYSSALESLFLKKSSKIMEGYGQMTITQLTPATLFSDAGKTLRSSGVRVSAQITAR